MTLFEAILVPLDGSALAARSLGVASWLATRLGARLHVLSAGTPASEDEALARLNVPEKYRRRIELHQVGGKAASEILDAIHRLRIGLIVMTGQGQTGSAAPRSPARIVGHVSCEVIERSRVPVLVLPPAYEESLPWRSLLVALSGEIAKDEALTIALRLARPLDVQVSVAHVCSTEAAGRRQPNRIYSDVSPHDLAERLNEMVAGACPMCSAEERGHIRDFHLVRGDVAQELLHLIEEKQAGMLVVGWHGQFMEGRARILKSLLQQARCPVLLVQPKPKPPSRLKVGEVLGERRSGSRPGD